MYKERKNRDYSGSERLQAFLLYLENGRNIESVKRRFPQHLPFVLAHSNKSYQEVKDIALGLVLHF